MLPPSARLESRARLVMQLPHPTSKQLTGYLYPILWRAFVRPTPTSSVHICLILLQSPNLASSNSPPLSPFPDIIDSALATRMQTQTMLPTAVPPSAPPSQRERSRFQGGSLLSLFRQNVTNLSTISSSLSLLQWCFRPAQVGVPPTIR